MNPDSSNSNSIPPHQSVPSFATLPATAAMDPVQRKAGVVLLVISILSGIGLSLPCLFAGPLALDEYGTYWLAGRNNPKTLWERSLNYENIPPLSPWLHRIFMDVLGESEFAFRLPSAVWFVTAIVAAWFLGKEVMGPAGGGLTALVVAWHPNALGEIRIARCYSLSFFLAGLLFWLTLRWRRFPEHHRYALGWAAVATGLVWSHYLNVIVLSASLVVLIWNFRTESIVARLALLGAVLLFAASLLPLLPALLRMSVWGESFGFQGEPSLSEILSPMWWAGYPAGFLTAYFSGWIIRQKSPRIPVARSHLRTLFLWGILPTILVALFCRGDLSSLSNPRYRIGFEIAGACFLVAILCRGQNLYRSIAGVVAAIVVSWAVADRVPWDLKRLGAPVDSEWKDLARYVEQHGEPGDLVFVQGGLGEGFLIHELFEDAVFMDYAACRMGRFYLTADHPRYGLPFFWAPGSPVEVFFERLLAETGQTGDTVIWVASATDTDLNIASLQGIQYLLRRQGFREADSKKHSDCLLLAYRRNAPGADATAP